MRLSADCMSCMIRRQAENIRDYPDEEKKARYFREVLRLVCGAPEDACAPAVTERINLLHETFFGRPYSFRELKEKYNRMMLEREQEIGAEIAASTDPLRTALQFARTGNYIDFGAMGSVDDKKLSFLLDQAQEEDVDDLEYAGFRRDLENASRLVYCTDNCGEIVLDKLLISELQKRYPGLQITVLVRGYEVLNDATLEDADQVGLTKLTAVLGNGSHAAGTVLNAVSREALQVLEEADVIVAKGQGNFESLHGCGRNIYYLFLCKCDWFTRRFGLERYKGVFINERNHRIA